MIKIFCLSLFIVFISITAFGWTAVSYQAMAEDALRLAPPKLVLIIEKNEKEFKRGLNAPLKSEGGEIHCLHVDNSYGKAHTMVSYLLNEAIELSAEQGHLDDIAYRLGMVAHLIADVNNPLNTSERDKKEKTYREDFSRYLERKRPKFILTFDGYEKNFFSTMNVSAYLQNSAKRANLFYSYLGQSYYKGGKLRSSSSFDDRSTPFGIAASSYSHAVSDIVKLWSYFWNESRGNMRGTPYLKVID